MKALALDLGAGSGRAVVGEFTGERLVLTEVHRFANEPVHLRGHLHWDFLRLLHEVRTGFARARLAGFRDLASFGLDSWAVDFGLLDENGELLGNPYHYRDAQTEGMIDRAAAAMSREDIYARTGIQFLPFNTIYQLYAMRLRDAAALRQARRLLLMPDLFRYALTGSVCTEFTNATTTQLFNPFAGDWDREILRALDLPHLFAPLVRPGERVGTLLPETAEELGCGPVPMIAVGEHDTASAVAAVPSESADFAYLSSGTWSLMGTLVPAPLAGAAERAANFTNEGGVDGDYRLLKNIMGLWIVQECLRVWSASGASLGVSEAVAAAALAAPFRSLIDPDADEFFAPPDMPDAIARFCRASGQPVPRDAGETVRCVLESLALRYRSVLEEIEHVAGRRYAGLHVVGGGSQNELLCQFTANAIQRPVWAGPTEATAVGNVLAQLAGLGAIADSREGRLLVRRSFAVRTYEPRDVRAWDEAYGDFAARIDRRRKGSA